MMARRSDRQGPNGARPLVRRTGRRGAAHRAACRRPRRARRGCARCSAASAAAPSGWCFEGGVGRSEWERMRCAHAGGRVPLPGEVRLLRDRRGGGRACRSPGPQRVLPASAPGLLHVPADRLAPDPRRGAAAPRHAGRQHGDRPQRPVGQRRRPGRPHRGGGRRRRRAAGRIPGRAAAGRGGDGGRRGRRRGGPGGGPRRRLRAARSDAPAEADVVFHCQRHRRRPRHRHRLRRPGGDHRRDELVRRQAGRGRTSAAPSTAAG